MIPHATITTRGTGLRRQVEHLLEQVEHEINGRKRNMMFYDSSIDALIDVRDRIRAVLEDDEGRR